MEEAESNGRRRQRKKKKLIKRKDKKSTLKKIISKSSALTQISPDLLGIIPGREEGSGNPISCPSSMELLSAKAAENSHHPSLYLMSQYTFARRRKEKYRCSEPILQGIHCSATQ